MPTVTTEQPTSNIFVTARGEVPIKIAVKDDMAIQQVTLHFSRSDRTDVQDFAIPLYQVPSEAPRRSRAGNCSLANWPKVELVEHRSVARRVAAGRR